MAVDEALVDAFVAGAQQHRAGAASELGHRAPAERRPAGVNFTTGAATSSRAVRANRGQRALERLDQHHHARAAAEGAVVDTRVRRVGEVAQLPERTSTQPCSKARRVMPCARSGRTARETA